MSDSNLVDQLIDALQIMPGIGQKSAQRIAFHLFQRDREGALYLSQVLAQAMDKVNNCQRCRSVVSKPGVGAGHGQGQ